MHRGGSLPTRSPTPPPPPPRPAGKPRRLSLKFLKEERARLEHWREGCRQQYQSGAALADAKVADHLPRPLAVGQVRLGVDVRCWVPAGPPLSSHCGCWRRHSIRGRALGVCGQVIVLVPLASKARLACTPPMQRVVARHPTTRQLHDGQVLTAAHNCYR